MSDLPRYRAVIVGVSRYCSHEDNLPYAVPSARRLAASLQAFCSFERIRLLKNEEATRDVIVRTIQDECQGMARGDGLLVALFGHGAYRERGQRWRFLPYEASAVDPSHTKCLTDADLFRETLVDLPVGHILVIIDACHSGMVLASPRGLALPEPSQDEVTLSTLMSPDKASVFLMASGASSVPDGGGDGCSIYTQTLCDVLGHSSERVTTAAMLAETVRTRVVRETALTPCPMSPCHGHMAGNRDAIFCFAPVTPRPSSLALQEAASQSMKQGRTEDAMRCLGAATLIDRSNRYVWTSLAAIYTQLGFDAEAEPLIRTAILLGRRDSDVFRCVTGLDHLDRTVNEESPWTYNLLMDSGQTCFDAGLFSSAIKYWDAASKRNPDKPIAFIKMGMAYSVYLGDAAAALRMFLSVVKLQHEGSYASEQIRLLLFDGLTGEISRLCARQEFRDALCIEADRRGLALPQARSFQEAIDAGDGECGHGRYRSAILLYREAHHLTFEMTERMQAFTRVGSALKAVFEDSTATTVFEALLSAYPKEAKRFGWWYDLGHLRQRANLYHDAVAFQNMVLDDDPGDVAALWSKGVCLWAMGQQADARKCFEQILSRDPGFEYLADLRRYLGQS